MFRHRTHTQALLPLDAHGVIAAGTRFEMPVDLASIRCFEVPPEQAVVLHRGTWNWGPYARNAAVLNLVNLQAGAGLRTTRVST